MALIYGITLEKLFLSLDFRYFQNNITIIIITTIENNYNKFKINFLSFYQMDNKKSIRDSNRTKNN